MTAAPEGLNTDIPHPARIYDFFLGGKDNFEADREAARKVIADFPDAARVARQNREFMRDAAALMVGLGIRQFLDLGSGLPTADNLHQVAQRAAPGTKVVYVDDDPIVLVHGRALLASDDSTSVITADLREPDLVWEQAEQTGLLDLEQPVGLMMIAVLHFVPGDLTDLVGAYLDRLPDGSHLALSHVTDQGLDPQEIEQATGPYARTRSGLHFRTPEQIEALFDGIHLLEPGLVPTWQWCPEPEDARALPRIRRNVDVKPTSPVILASVGHLSASAPTTA